MGCKLPDSRRIRVELQSGAGVVPDGGGLEGIGAGRSLMFNGHLDINPIAAGWTRDPFDPWIAAISCMRRAVVA
jgi:acetylornithine deacetylase/succinyl-diaminopimelate desuccinylase-like protein